MPFHPIFNLLIPKIILKVIINFSMVKQTKQEQNNKGSYHQNVAFRVSENFYSQIISMLEMELSQALQLNQILLLENQRIEVAKNNIQLIDENTQKNASTKGEIRDSEDSKEKK